MEFHHLARPQVVQNLPGPLRQSPTSVPGEMVEHDRHGVNSVAKRDWDLLPISSNVSSSLAHLDGPALVCEGSCRKQRLGDCHHSKTAPAPLPMPIVTLASILPRSFTISPEAVL